MSLSMYGVTVSKNNISVKLSQFLTALGNTNKIPVMVVGTFTISVVDQNTPIPN